MFVFVRIMVLVQWIWTEICLLKSETKKEIVTFWKQHIQLSKGSVLTTQVHNDVLCSAHVLAFLLQYILGDMWYPFYAVVDFKIF